MYSDWDEAFNPPSHLCGDGNVDDKLDEYNAFLETCEPNAMYTSQGEFRSTGGGTPIEEIKKMENEIKQPVQAVQVAQPQVVQPQIIKPLKSEESYFDKIPRDVKQSIFIILFGIFLIFIIDFIARVGRSI